MVPLSLKRNIHMGVFVHKIVNSNGPKEMVLRYNERLKTTHSHYTRATARADMKSMTHNTSRFKTSTQHRAIKCWNNIPINLRSIQDSSAFKKRYPSVLVDNFKNDDRCIHSHC